MQVPSAGWSCSGPWRSSACKQIIHLGPIGRKQTPSWGRRDPALRWPLRRLSIAGGETSAAAAAASAATTLQPERPPRTPCPSHRHAGSAGRVHL